jgi:GNAT superfamily N-acetyltransferase
MPPPLPPLPAPPRRVRLEGRTGHYVYDPLEIVATLDDVELWRARYESSVASQMPRYVGSVLAFDRPAQTYVGRVDLHETIYVKEAAHKLQSLEPGGPCEADLAMFAALRGTRAERAVTVSSSFLAPSVRGRGLGAALYTAAAAVAAQRGMALVADACTFEGTTSEMARRVWASRNFRARVDVGPSGLVGVLRR